MSRSATRGVFSGLVFELQGQRFALAADVVREVLPALSVTPLPSAPAVVEGVIDLRGSLVPVLDIRSRFGMAGGLPHFRDHIVVAQAGSRTVAIRTDRALDLVELPAAGVEELSAAVPNAEYISGVVRMPDGLVLIHDLETFLSAAEADSLDAALEQVGREEVGEE